MKLGHKHVHCVDTEYGGGTCQVYRWGVGRGPGWGRRSEGAIISKQQVIRHGSCPLLPHAGSTVQCFSKKQASATRDETDGK